jgi:predicted nucleotidyltransferase
MDHENLKEIIFNWASTLPVKVRVYLFGSRLKGTAKSDSDLDIAIEFLESDDDLMWFDYHDKWQGYLTDKTGLSVDLQLYEGDRSPHLKKYLNDSSIILYEPEVL